MVSPSPHHTACATLLGVMIPWDQRRHACPERPATSCIGVGVAPEQQGWYKNRVRVESTVVESPKGRTQPCQSCVCYDARARKSGTTKSMRRCIPRIARDGGPGIKTV